MKKKIFELFICTLLCTMMLIPNSLIADCNKESVISNGDLVTDYDCTIEFNGYSKISIHQGFLKTSENNAAIRWSFIKFKPDSSLLINDTLYEGSGWLFMFHYRGIYNHDKSTRNSIFDGIVWFCVAKIE